MDKTLEEKSGAMVVPMLDPEIVSRMRLLRRLGGGLSGSPRKEESRATACVATCERVRPLRSKRGQGGGSMGNKRSKPERCSMDPRRATP